MNFSGSIIFFGCRDLDSIRNFYGGVLDFDLYKDQGSCLIYKLPGGNYLGYCQHLEKKAADRSPIITLLCETQKEVDEFYHYFKNADRPTDQPPKVNEKFNLYHFFARDPEGYTLEIQCFL